MLRWSTDLLVVGHLLHAFGQFAPQWNLGQISVGHLVLCLHPFGGFLAVVVFQPAVGVSHLGAEIFVHYIAFGAFRIMCLCQGSNTGHGHGNTSKFLFHDVFRLNVWAKIRKRNEK